jgi:Icc-related predicted phosphoesterase
MLWQYKFLKGVWGMKIYAVADIHGHPDRLAFIRRNIFEFKPHVLVVAGDITGYFHPRPVISQLNAMPVPVLAVRGNSDLPRVESLFEQFDNVASLNLTEVTFGSVSFTGLSGTIPVPFRSRICFREKRAMGKISRMVNPLSVVVAHSPPWGVLDRVMGKLHAGSRGLRRMILEKQPRVVICGHIHEDTGTGFIKDTLVVNCSIGRSGKGLLMEFEGDGLPAVEFI